MKNKAIEKMNIEKSADQVLRDTVSLEWQGETIYDEEHLRKRIAEALQQAEQRGRDSFLGVWITPDTPYQESYRKGQQDMKKRAIEVAENNNHVCESPFPPQDEIAKAIEQLEVK